MRILYVYSAWAIWGGIERVLIDKMNYLADTEGYEIYTLTYDQGTNPIPFPLSSKVIYRDLNVRLYHHYRYHGLKKYYYKYKLQKLLVKRLQSEILEIMPDVIVCPRVDLLSYILKAKGRIPLVYESHSSYKWIAMEKKGLVWFFRQHYYNRLVKKVQMVVSLTEGDALEWRKITNHVSVIPNVVKLNYSGQYSNCQSKSVIFVGRLSLQKDVHSLLRIWSIVHKRFPEWQLHIYGDRGEETESIVHALEQISENIYLHEPTSQIFDKYLDSSMILSTSLYEPFGLVLPEAMSCGLPVVAFDCPYGPSEIITDGVDGFLIRNRDLQEFAQKVCLLIENQEMRLQMGRAGIQSARRYEASQILPMWKTLFRQLSGK
jgi:glycosyltransferase involved in cell wall biosynthesis